MSFVKNIYNALSSWCVRKRQVERFSSNEKAPKMLQMVVRVANLVGVAGPPEYRYRFVVVFAFFVVMIVVPKVAFGYPDVGSLITGMAELVFQINNCGGMLILYVLNDDFVEVRDRFQLFVDNGEMKHDLLISMN